MKKINVKNLTPNTYQIKVWKKVLGLSPLKLAEQINIKEEMFNSVYNEWQEEQTHIYLGECLADKIEELTGVEIDENKYEELDLAGLGKKLYDYYYDDVLEMVKDEEKEAKEWDYAKTLAMYKAQGF